MGNCPEEIANVLLISGSQDKLSRRNFNLAKTLLPDDHNDLTCLVGLLRYVDIGHVLSQMRHLLDACSIHYLQKIGHFWAWILVPSMKHKISVAVKCWYSYMSYVINMTCVWPMMPLSHRMVICCDHGDLGNPSDCRMVAGYQKNSPMLSI